MDVTSTIKSKGAKGRVDIRVKLSLLWVIVMFNMIYADILAIVSAFITPGVVEELMNGYSGSVKLTQELLFVSAVLIEIPILMILLSRVLSYRWNRVANIAASLLTILFVVGGSETYPFFIFYVGIEVLVMLIILWLSVTWKTNGQLETEMIAEASVGSKESTAL